MADFFRQIGMATKKMAEREGNELPTPLRPFMLKTTPQNYGGLLFVITNPKNPKGKAPAGPLSAVCGRTRQRSAGRDGLREKRPENEKNGQPKKREPSPLSLTRSIPRKVEG